MPLKLKEADFVTGTPDAIAYEHLVALVDSINQKNPVPTAVIDAAIKLTNEINTLRISAPNIVTTKKPRKSIVGSIFSCSSISTPDFSVVLTDLNAQLQAMLQKANKSDISLAAAGEVKGAAADSLNDAINNINAWTKNFKPVSELAESMGPYLGEITLSALIADESLANISTDLDIIKNSLQHTKNEMKIPSAVIDQMAEKLGATNNGESKEKFVLDRLKKDALEQQVGEYEKGVAADGTPIDFVAVNRGAIQKCDKMDELLKLDSFEREGGGARNVVFSRLTERKDLPYITPLKEFYDTIGGLDDALSHATHLTENLKTESPLKIGIRLDTLDTQLQKNRAMIQSPPAPKNTIAIT